MIGNGNVALDVARMLALTPEELAPTDTTDAAIEAINASGIREILVVGRRGPVQAAWTPVEVGELGELAGADVIVDPADLELDPASEAELAAAAPTVRRNVDHLRDYAAREPDRQAARDPAALLLVAGRDPRRREGRGDRARPERARRRARRRDRRARDDRLRDRLPQRRLPGRPASGRAVRRAHRRRSRTRAARVEPGLYAAGWIKRGPSGVIGTNKKDATETVALLLEDAARGPAARTRRRTLEQLLEERGVDAVLYAGWEAIDPAERSAGEPHGRPRIKLCSWDATCSPPPR